MPDNSDPVKDFVEQVRRTKEEQVKAHQKVLNSPEYEAEWKHIEGATFHFIQAIHACFMMSRRAPELYDKMLMFRLTDDLIQSALAIMFLVKNGMHNPVAREVRFMVESGVKQLFVDQQKPGESFEDRLQFLHDEVDRSSISMVEQLQLSAFDEVGAKEFYDELTDLYYKQCAFIHPSRRQIEEMVTRAEAGKPLGFETADELRKIGRLIFRLYDMLLVLQFHGVGLSLAGDIFSQWFDCDLKWKFHKGKYTKRVSAHFDYKAERVSKYSERPQLEPPADGDKI